jgi:hypothetical protein
MLDMRKAMKLLRERYPRMQIEAREVAYSVRC